MSSERERILMRSHELEADNMVLIDIVEEHIKVMQSSVQMLKTILISGGHLKLVISENIAEAEKRISSSRDFLDKLYAEGKYPQYQ